MEPRPPRLAELLIGRLLPREDREPLLGDLEEEHAERAAAEGGAAARAWYWRQVAGSLAPVLRLHLGRRGDRRYHPAHAPPREKRMQTLWQDLRHAVRLVRRSPGFAAAVVLTLALGIGGSTIVFSAVDGMVLNPFPFPQPERLVGIGPEFPRLGQDLSFREVLSPAEFEDIRDGVPSLQRVVAWDMGNRQVTVGNATENLLTGFWWGDALSTLGVAPAVGRGFLPEETEGGEPVAVLSHRVWQSHFGADPSLVGAPILINGQPYTLVGVMPPGTLVMGTDLWVPMPVGPEVFPRDGRQFQVLARLAPDATLERASAELRTLAQRVEAEHGSVLPEYQGWSLQAMTWNDVNVRTLKPAALLLMGAVGFVLLLVCSNVATLLLVKATGRRRELAMRRALGAGRGRLLRQLLTESILLSSLGGALGVALGWLGIRALARAVAALSVPLPGNVEMDGRVLLFSVVVSVGAGVLFGILPAFQGAGVDVQDELKSEGTATTGASRRMRLQRLLVGVEVALAMVLLVAGGLLVHSFLRLRAVEPGFDTSNVLTMRLTLARERYEAESIDPFFRELVRRAEEIPGVSSAATATQFPPSVFGQREILVEGRPAPAEGMLPTAFTTITSPEYFETLGIPLLRGRLYSDADRGPLVTVINQAAADLLFPGADPVGKRVSGGDESGPWLEIVGVVGSTRNLGLDTEPQPELFANSRQVDGFSNQHFLLLRTRVEPRSLIPAVREVVRAMDPQQPVYRIQTMEEAFALSDAPRRISAAMLSLFAGFALLLAALGIYGVSAYSVGQRRREIGVRLALGARARQVRWLVLRQAFPPIALGAAVGLAGALVLSRAMSGLLFGVSASDPLTLLAVAVLLAGVALVATYVPARRASRLDPLRALREGSS